MDWPRPSASQGGLQARSNRESIPEGSKERQTLLYALDGETLRVMGARLDPLLAPRHKTHTGGDVLFGSSPGCISPLTLGRSSTRVATVGAGKALVVASALLG